MTGTDALAGSSPPTEAPSVFGNDAAIAATLEALKKESPARGYDSADGRSFWDLTGFSADRAGRSPVPEYRETHCCTSRQASRITPTRHNPVTLRRTSDDNFLAHNTRRSHKIK